MNYIDYEPVRKFITDNIDLIDMNDYDELYMKITGELFKASELTMALKEVDVDPINYLTYIPQEYLYRTDIAEVVIPKNKIEVIKPRAYAYCYKLTEVVIPEGVQMIGNMAFAECKALTKVTFPKSLVSIGHAAFFGTDVREIHYNGTLEEWGNVEECTHWMSSFHAINVPIQCLDGEVRAKV